MHVCLVEQESKITYPATFHSSIRMVISKKGGEPYMQTRTCLSMWNVNPTAL